MQNRILSSSSINIGSVPTTNRATRGGAHRSDAPYQRNANARGLVGRAVLCTPLNSAAKSSDIVRWSDSATDPPSLSRTARQLRLPYNPESRTMLCVSEFQFSGLPAVALAKAGDSSMLFGLL